ncbi:ArsR/SmtB family transcription factor [Nocardioides sp. LHG3406-4]|uniref:ArsR/SmtB family transcription factor n=1 Tax=Nocardioides sp. LHG3406-4 TaxID=2804575 RepID=UPI003CEBCBE7
MEDQISALRATAHPVRLRIMSLLTGTAMSAAEVSRELGISHANASYHLRTLLDVGELVEAGEEKIRGGLAKRYRYPHEHGGRPAKGPRPSPEEFTTYLKAVHREVERRSHLPRERPGFSSDLEGWVPPEVWEEASALLMQVSRLLHDNNTAPRTEDTVHVSVTLTAFSMEEAP